MSNRARWGEIVLFFSVFVLCAGFHLWAVHVGWKSYNLPGVEFRQAQTGLSAEFIQREHNFSLAYPTPVLGKPWSIPMEFPLYQWTVVIVSNVTHLSLTHAARMVSIVCFYLTLPAVLLLLGHWQVAWRRRWLVLALLLTAPLYIYYARAFLMETMALMFAVWFWTAFLSAVQRRSGWWLALAAVAGSGAGLVKVTTFLLYLIPPALWCARRLWQGRFDGRWRGDLAWIAGTVAVPFAASIWWVIKADAIKALNPMAWFLSAENLRGFNLGTLSTRFSPQMWATKWHLITHAVTWWPALALLVLLTLWMARRRWREIAICAGTFAAALVIFPSLYTFHDYYYAANTLLLMLALGLAFVGATEAGRPLWFTGALWLAVLGGQALVYHTVYYPSQAAISPGGNGLSRSLRALTQPDDVVVVAGQDWNSMTPYYSRRRALMLREDELGSRQSARIQKALANLRGETIGALVLPKDYSQPFDLVSALEPFGIGPRPLYQWQDLLVYVPEARRAADKRILRDTWFQDVSWAPGVVPPEGNLAGAWHDYAGLSPRDQALFDQMTPRPVRFFCTYQPARDGRAFGANAWTKLVFHLSAGTHQFTTFARLPEAAYAPDRPRINTTDGVDITLEQLRPGQAPLPIYHRRLNPRDRPADRGTQLLRAKFTLAAPGEVELVVGPGPAGNDNYDWLHLGPVLFRPIK